MSAPLMHLKVLLPSCILADVPGVARIVAETPEGSFGLLPHRLDCAAALVPGILSYTTAAGEEAFVALDEGVLVKAGAGVTVSVRRAQLGRDLGQLRAKVVEEFRIADQGDQAARAVMARLEVGLLSGVAAFERE
jgi:F-type H+-transporting ATPase subunit epsilon